MSNKEHQLEVLNQATRELMASESRKEVANTAVEAARDILELEANAIHLYDGEVSGLVPVAQTDVANELIGDPPTFTEGDSIAWRVYTQGNSVAIDDVRTDPDIHNLDTVVRGELFFPLDEHGILIATSPSTDAFDSGDKTLGEILAANTVTALEQVERTRQLQNREEELLRQNDRLEEFVNFVSHDLRNPLSVAKGHLELARADCESDHLTEVATAHDRMDALIEDLLTLARTGSHIDEVRSVNLQEIAEECWRNVTTEKADLVVETTQTITADRGRLQRLLENLFRNAVEHGDETVTVTVGDLTSDDGFYVADDGSGIPEDDWDAVFESGYSTQQDGTGLGLAIVEEIVTTHGWDIQLAESEDGGARFEISGLDLSGQNN
ncbi:sensor histidine kinase [Natrialba swarupiae]|uniref:histidine kinase n=1 Tax=Natrialba swarupiae TaxID=2448032 RepID=A0A5D5AI31_9EURY|nr:GAF domain-containing sensor histidine kinase [Natrialba swarupiae]TYT60665.1 GAF domain-containing protein [Natrialba swarupiae]